MSGFVGVYRRDGGPADREELARATERLAHRGLVGRGTRCAGPAGLGQLAGYETRATPFALPELGLSIAADARIDDRVELAARLGVSPELDDTALILHAYARWGDDCPRHLLGDFAFALWDDRRQRLFCARDAMGVKPFYYHVSPRLFACASEAKALFCLAAVPRQLNETRLADFLVPMLEDDPVSTCFRDVARLPPAHSLAVDADGTELRRYWRLDPAQELRLRTAAEYDEAFRHHFGAAVRRRLRGGPVGSLLSGGLDSSAIVCVARQQLASPLPTFSAVFDALPQCDERRFSAPVLAGGGIDPHFVAADRAGALSYLDWFFAYEDEPFWMPNMFWIVDLYRAAAAAGVRVLLDGTDGDTAVSHGLSRLTELAGGGRWWAFAREVRALAGHSGASAWQLTGTYGVRPLVPEPARTAWRWLRRRNRPWWSGDLLLSREFIARAGLAPRLRQAERDYSHAARTARAEHVADLQAASYPYCLEIFDRAAAACGVEPRYPFFDRELLAFCVSLPAEQKLDQGQDRAIMRRALAGSVPAEVRGRAGKADLSPNFTRALLAERARLDELMLGDDGGIREYVDMEAARAVYRRLLDRADRGAIDRPMTVDAVGVWKVALLATWLRRTGEGPAPGPRRDREMLTT